jgi:hypothetical protein
MEGSGNGKRHDALRRARKNYAGRAIVKTAEWDDPTAADQSSVAMASSKNQFTKMKPCREQAPPQALQK